MLFTGRCAVAFASVWTRARAIVRVSWHGLSLINKYRISSNERRTSDEHRHVKNAALLAKHLKTALPSNERRITKFGFIIGS